MFSRLIKKTLDLKKKAPIPSLSADIKENIFKKQVLSLQSLLFISSGTLGLGFYLGHGFTSFFQFNIIKECGDIYSGKQTYSEMCAKLNKTLTPNSKQGEVELTPAEMSAVLIKIQTEVVERKPIDVSEIQEKILQDRVKDVLEFEKQKQEFDTEKKNFELDKKNFELDKKKHEFELDQKKQASDFDQKKKEFALDQKKLELDKKQFLSDASKNFVGSNNTNSFGSTSDKSTSTNFMDPDSTASSDIKINSLKTTIVEKKDCGTNT